MASIRDSRSTTMSKRNAKGQLALPIRQTLAGYLYSMKVRDSLSLSG